MDRKTLLDAGFSEGFAEIVEKTADMKSYSIINTEEGNELKVYDSINELQYKNKNKDTQNAICNLYSKSV